MGVYEDFHYSIMTIYYTPVKKAVNDYAVKVAPVIATVPKTSTLEQTGVLGVNANAKSILDKILENGKVTDTTGYNAGGTGIVQGAVSDLSKYISDGIVDGVKRSVEYLGEAFKELLISAWELLVDLSLYSCMTVATVCVLFLYNDSGGKKAKTWLYASVILYIVIQIINGALIKHGFIG